MRIRASWAIALAVVATRLSAANYIVEFREPVGPGRGTEPIQQFRADLGRLEQGSTRSGGTASIRREYGTLFNGAALRLSREDAVREILALPYVANVYLDREVSAAPIERSSAEPYSARPPAGGGNGIVVAVVDSGIDYTHPALGGSLGPSAKVRGGWDFVNDDADPMDDNLHGTHVAGIIAAKSPAITGIAPEASLLAYKVLDSRGKGLQSDVIAAIERAVDPNGDGNFSDRAHVINISLGSAGHPDDPVAKAVDRASALGVVVVAAVGNSGEEHAISSPALARTALAVGAVDGGRQVAEFSARGPAAQSAGVKPDVLAPGVLIRSTTIGGGTLVLSGTSMAAPHVAAIAARLLEVHPTWSSERVRAAIVSSSYPIPGTAVTAQGAGVVDIPTALSSAIYVQPNALGFGVLNRTSSVWSVTRTIRLRSEYDVPVTIRGDAHETPAGLKLTIEPESLELQPGVEREIAVRLEADVAAIDAHHQAMAIGGWIKLVRGSAEIYVPWVLIRAARIRTTSPFEFPDLVWSTDRAARGDIAALDPYTFETLLEPAVYDLALVSASGPDAHVIVRENVVVDGDLDLQLTAADAPHRVSWEASDPSGGPLSRLQSGSRLYTATGRLLFSEGERSWSMQLPTPLRTIRSSGFGSRWSLLVTETAIDVDASRAVVAQHPPLTGLSSDTVLRMPPEAYAPQRVEALFPGDAAEHNLWFLPRGMTRRPFEAARRPEGIGVANLGQSWRGTIWMTPEVHPDYVSGVQLGLYTGDPFMQETSSIVAPMIRRRGERFISGWDIDPAPVPVAAQPDETLQWGSGAIWPSTRLAVSSSGDGRSVWSGSIEVMGDRNERRRRETAKAEWRLVASDGASLAGGVLGLGGFITPPTTSRRLQLSVASPATERFAPADATLEIEMADAAQGDVTPPSLTSFVILDESGRHVRRVASGRGGSIVFSAADCEVTQDGTLYRAIAERLTRLFARPHDGSSWTEVPLHVLREDRGEGEQAGRLPVGHVFEADLSALSGFSGLTDLRIEVTDRSGHRSVWTLSPALSLEAGRKRPVNR